ncbi:metal ABC transporter permease [Ignavigranum ruoffiae]|uniref:metal ABC transporter permease n=1 Tax=Ignavigranum ruoffiae TaxID=89093 RepID=UPI0024ADA495|nr:metal ABC transporter permease [Ignavigranum ruoffiae]
MAMLQFDFIQRALMAGLAISFITPILGLLLILRRQSLMADTLAHISLAGVALGALLGIQPTWTTLLIVVLASLIIEYLRIVFVDFSEISVAMMMATGMAFALMLVGLNSNQGNFQIEQFLFGSIILVSEEGVRLLIALAVLVVLLYLIFRKPLYVISFDEATAKTLGLPVRFISVCFSVLTGLAISVMMPIVGALLVSALIVIPSATAIKISRSFTQAILVGVLINLLGIFVGISASFYWDTPPGASITMVFILIFSLVSLSHRIFSKLNRRA